MKALFEIDCDGHANGIVYHFCDKECREAFMANSSSGVTLEAGESNDAINDTQCDHCGLVLRGAA